MHKDKAARQAWFRDRYAKRQALAADILGGKCAKCGTSRGLEVDHIDPSTKLFQIGSSRGANCSEELFLAELAKCQLLCGKCHDKKSIADNGKLPAKGTHGTLSSYRYCKCHKCKAAKSDWNKAYHARTTQCAKPFRSMT